MAPRCNSVTARHDTDRSKNILWRVIIIAIVGFVFLEFSELIWMELNQLARSFDLFTLTAGVLGPALAIAAGILALANKYLSLATICAVSSLVIFVTPMLVFMFGLAR